MTHFFNFTRRSLIYQILSCNRLERKSQFLPAFFQKVYRENITLLKRKFTSMLAGFLAAIAVSAHASTITTLKLSISQDQAHPVYQSIQFMAERVRDYTDGTVEIRIYPSGQLGTQRESVELLQSGALDMAKSNASSLELFEAAYGTFNVPYLFRDREHFYRVLTCGVGSDILGASKGKGFLGLTYYDGGARSFYAQRRIQSPADLSGMKIRVQPSFTAIRMISLMGGSPTPLAYGELYTALQQGVVDGAENNETALDNSRHGEVTRFFSTDEHTMIPDVLVISETSWSGLAKKQRSALRKAAEESMVFHKRLWSEVIKKARKKSETIMGVQFISVDKKPFIDAVELMHHDALMNKNIGRYIKKIDTLVARKVKNGRSHTSQLSDY